MAIPYNPSIYDLCKTALRRAGQPAPSTGMIGEAMRDQFQEVKNDIKLNAPTHPLLESEEITVTVIGKQFSAQPTKANVVKSCLLFDGPDSWRKTLTTGDSFSWTMPAGFSEDENTLIGKPIFSIAGTGTLQYSWIRAYNNSTRVLTITPGVSTIPSSDTDVVIANYRNEVYNSSRQVIHHNDYSSMGKGLPLKGALEGEKLFWDKGPDKIYPLLWSYYLDIDQMDEDDSQFIKILREWRNIFIEGVTAKSMVLYDDNRQYEHIKIYEFMLDRLRSEATTITQMEPYDPVLY